MGFLRWRMWAAAAPTKIRVLTKSDRGRVASGKVKPTMLPNWLITRPESMRNATLNPAAYKTDSSVFRLSSLRSFTMTYPGTKSK